MKHYEITSYSETLKCHTCKDKSSGDPVFIDLVASGISREIPPESLVGKTLSCDNISPFICMALGAEIK